MTQFDDRGLQERFAELRAVDRSRAPSVAATLGQPARRVRRASRAAALVASAALVLVAVVWIRHDGHPVAPVAISAWQPASDVLLRSARSPMLGPMPPLGASVLDQYIHTSPR